MNFAPVSKADAQFTSPNPVRVIGNLAANVPPKPQPRPPSPTPPTPQTGPFLRHFREQFSRFLFFVQLAQAVAAIVESHLVRKACTEVGNPEFSHQKIAELENPI